MSKVINISNAKIYQAKKLVIDNVWLSIEQGEFVYLIGKTGSGKSSLLKTLYAEIPLIEGEGLVADYNLRRLATAEIPFLRRKIGIVFQDFQLLMDRTVIQNLYFVLGATGWTDKALIHKRALSVLQLVGVEQKANDFPHALSGGEQQRVSIARALLNQPQLLLADEPTGNLDSNNANEINELFLKIRKEMGVAIVIVTHNSSLASISDRQLLMKDGNLIA